MLSFLIKQADELTSPIEAVGNVLDALFTSDKEPLLARIAQDVGLTTILYLLLGLIGMLTFEKLQRRAAKPRCADDAYAERAWPQSKR